MFSREEARELLDDLFEEEVLLVGGIMARHQVGEEFIWTLMRNLDQIRNRFLSRIEEMPEETSEPGNEANLTPHPAIEGFLLKLHKTPMEQRRRKQA